MTAGKDPSKYDPHRSPPADLPADPARFWSAGVDLDELASPDDAATTPALKKLGPLPVSRSSFPLLGFLATVYEEIAAHAKQAAASDADPAGE
jgi:hypothetical protein